MVTAWQKVQKGEGNERGERWSQWAMRKGERRPEGSNANFEHVEYRGKKAKSRRNVPMELNATSGGR